MRIASCIEDGFSFISHSDSIEQELPLDVYMGPPCVRNPSLDAVLLTQPRNKVANLNKCCDQKHGKTAPPK